MFKNLLNKIKSTYTVQNYMKIMPYVKPYWFRGLMSVLITIPIGSMDAVIAWSLRPYMDIVMVEKNTTSTNYIPVLIVVFSCLQSSLNYLATYLNTWFGRKLANDVKLDLFIVDSIDDDNMELANKRVTDYLKNRLYGKLETKIHMEIMIRDNNLINKAKESYLRYQEITLKTVKE